MTEREKIKEMAALLLDISKLNPPAGKIMTIVRDGKRYELSVKEHKND